MGIFPFTQADALGEEIAVDFEDRIIEVINQQRGIDTLSKRIQPLIHNLYHSAGQAGQQLSDFLNGVWLGHPLHAVLTDVVVGAYTVGLAFDGLEAATGEELFGKAADNAISLGALTAVGAATAGMTDWMYTSDTPRRVGMVHALLNTTALSLYTASLAARKGRNRQVGKALGLLGFIATLGAAYLGGHLAYRNKIGVNHAPGPAQFPQKFTPVIALETLPEDKLVRAEANDIPILLVRRGKDIYALAETCAHLGGPLAEGTLVDNSVICPWHGSRFNLESGHIINGPSVHPQPCLQTRVRNGQVEVRAAPGDVA